LLRNAVTERAVRPPRSVVSKIRSVLFPLVFVAILAVAAKRFMGDLDDVEGSPDPSLLAVAVVLCALFYAFVATAWVTLSSTSPEDSLSNRRLYLAFLASQPFKYLPSSLFTFTARMRFAQHAGLTARRAAVVTLLDGLLLIGSGASLWVLGLWPYGTALVLVCGSLTVLLWGYVQRCLGWLGRRRGLEAVPHISRGVLAKVGTLYLLGWICAGLALVFLASSFGAKMNPTTVREIVGVNAGAFAASIVAVFAPAGLGVRETVLLNGNVAAEAILAWRVMTASFDILGGAVGALALRSRR